MSAQPAYANSTASDRSGTSFRVNFFVAAGAEFSASPAKHGNVRSPFESQRAMVVRRHLYLRAIDEDCGCAQDGPMQETVRVSSRRSQRVFHKMRLKVHGRAHNGKKFREVCETVVVNAHGGLLALSNEVDNGEMIILENPVTQEEQECRIVFIGEAGNRGQRVGIEFLTPAPHFWGIEFEAPESPAT